MRQCIVQVWLFLCRMFVNIRSVWVEVVCVLLCSTVSGVCSAPRCMNSQSGCHVVSLSDLFDRVIQHSSRMHGISNDLHAEFEHYFLPSKNQISRVGRYCHTSSILTPNGKENTQRMAEQELMEVILKLLLAWRDPLWHFHQSIAHHHDFFNFSSNKALEMSDMVHELRKGVEKVAEKMQMSGIISNSVSSRASPEASPPADSPEWRLMKVYDLLHCFRRDSNKVQNYLKILKCRIVPQHGC
ncbi:prolactin 2 isoform X1 [Notolabrus celidotus]|uniref:prolactin 2 isoform X1 n=3 Tax=Notolabrus celidotus TaxID=1203425 RepID=UPI0014900308|nr:prolactin 2 isoform X1 [Notolabrus celidotus]